MGDMDMPILPPVDPATVKHEYVATCSYCSREQFNLMFTRAHAKLLVTAGMRCGYCNSASMQLEEFSTGAKILQ